MRLVLFLTALMLALVLGVAASQTPSPRGTDTPATGFSAARAMVDVREIARNPHPVGSADHDRVRDHLTRRMATLGLNPGLQAVTLSPEALTRLARWGQTSPQLSGTNIVGVLPGTDPALPAVLLMAHYDTVADSPGAADDSTGIAATLEAVRAIKARGPARRPLVLLFTDAEELNLDGARAFFSEHPLRDRIGAVVNLEARGGGGRAMMFETGPGNADTIALFTRAMARADGGSTSNSLAVFVYERMPNGTDFTIARQRGLAGVNLAFIGRPDQYHAPAATPDALDQGSVQHIGSQALEATDAFLRAPAAPRAANVQVSENRVYADILGRIFLSHRPATGWTLLATALALTAFAFWGARHATRLPIADVGRGLLAGLWMLSAGLVTMQAVRLLAGPLAARAETAETYYGLLRRLPWIEGGAALTALALALVLMAGREAVGRGVLVGTVLVACVVATLMGGIDPLVLVATAIATGLGLWSQAAPRSTWGSWLGLIALILLLGTAVQAIAPEAAFLLVWTGLLAASAAALSALIGARLQSLASLVPAAIATVLGGAWLVTLSHPLFLGIGMDLPGVLILMALLILVLARPMAPPALSRRLAGACAACLILACGVSLAARSAEPMTPAAVDVG